MDSIRFDSIRFNRTSRAKRTETKECIIVLLASSSSTAIRYDTIRYKTTQHNTTQPTNNLYEILAAIPPIQNVFSNLVQARRRRRGWWRTTSSSPSPPPPPPPATRRSKQQDRNEVSWFETNWTSNRHSTERKSREISCITTTGSFLLLLPSPANLYVLLKN